MYYAESVKGIKRFNGDSQGVINYQKGQLHIIAVSA